MLWRFPFGQRLTSWPPINPDAQAGYESLRERFDVADAVVSPAFTRHDEAALTAQAKHRRYQFAVIIGAALATVFGAVQAGWPDARWPGIVLAVFAALTTAVANQQRQARPMLDYLTERARAEELRSLYYRFLSGIGNQNRQTLEQAVAAIEFGSEERPS